MSPRRQLGPRARGGRDERKKVRGGAASIGSAHRAKRGNDLAALIIKQRPQGRHCPAWPRSRESPLSPLLVCLYYTQAQCQYTWPHTRKSRSRHHPSNLTDMASWRFLLSFLPSLPRARSCSSSMRLSHSWHVACSMCAAISLLVVQCIHIWVWGANKRESEREAILRGGERAIHFYY